MSSSCKSNLPPVNLADPNIHVYAEDFPQGMMINTFAATERLHTAYSTSQMICRLYAQHTYFRFPKKLVLTELLLLLFEALPNMWTVKPGKLFEQAWIKPVQTSNQTWIKPVQACIIEYLTEKRCINQTVLLDVLCNLSLASPWCCIAT